MPWRNMNDQDPECSFLKIFTFYFFLKPAFLGFTIFIKSSQTAVFYAVVSFILPRIEYQKPHRSAGKREIIFIVGIGKIIGKCPCKASSTFMISLYQDKR